MSRIQGIDPNQAQGKAKELLDKVNAKIGKVPNIFKNMANSPAVLEGYLTFSGALSTGALDPKLREQIALTVGQENACQYCLSAHTAIGKSVGLTDDEIQSSRQSNSSDAKIAAALNFSKKLVQDRAQINDDDLRPLRDAGYSEGEIAEIVANVCLNIFTNYFNHVCDPVIDFPEVQV